ncbi:MAG: hypothetical protein PHE50_01890 [Dehalococcoidales bacterium]|nr:hypothetical protein [Dehalococcoidales bacterium]
MPVDAGTVLPALTENPAPETTPVNNNAEILPAPSPEEKTPKLVKFRATLSEDEAVTIDELVALIKDDDTGYIGTMVKLKGLVESVSLEDIGDPHLLLSSPDMAMKHKARVKCDPRYSAAVRRMITGQRITVLGKYTGHDRTLIHIEDAIPVG